jgi:hypothetical protein
MKVAPGMFQLGVPLRGDGVGVAMRLPGIAGMTV